MTYLFSVCSCQFDNEILTPSLCAVSLSLFVFPTSHSKKTRQKLWKRYTTEKSEEKN